MREIKFRLWDDICKIMLGWEFARSFQLSILDNPIRFDNLTQHTYISMQFTGLYDKNGTEIYEGDILKHDLWGSSEVIWEHGMFRGKSVKDKLGGEHDITLADHQLKRCKVIGNIYER
jgi:uncharacterized phage protein (TIGR01671 family)